MATRRIHQGFQWVGRVTGYAWTSSVLVFTLLIFSCSFVRPAVAELTQHAPVADSFVSEMTPDTAFGSPGYIEIGYFNFDPGSPPQYHSHGLLRFNLSKIANNARIVRAELAAAVIEATGDSRVPIYVQNIGGPWNEKAVTYNSILPFLELRYDVHTDVDGIEYYVWDVTDIVGDWINKPTKHPNYGIWLVGDPKPGIGFTRKISTASVGLVVDWLPPTSTATPTSTPTHTRTYTHTFTPTPTPTRTQTYTHTFTPTRTFTFTPTATRTQTFTPVPFTPTPTATRTNTYTFTPTWTFTFTPTATHTHTFTPEPFTPTPTATRTETHTFTPTWTFTFTPTATRTHTFTPVPFTPTPTATRTETYTFTPTWTFTFTPTATWTHTFWPVPFTPTPTATRTDTYTFTPTWTFTFTPTATRTHTFTPEPSTPTPTPTATPTRRAGFNTSRRYGTGSMIPGGVAASDAMDVGGHRDLIVGGLDRPDLVVLRNDGDGAFRALPAVSASNDAAGGFGGLATEDLDADGQMDVMGTLPDSDVVVVARGDQNAATGLGPVEEYRVAGKPGLVRIGDVSGDGEADIIVASEAGLIVLSGDGEAGFGPAQALVPGGGVSDFAVTDIDGNGLPDIVLVRPRGAEVRFAEVPGSFTPPLTLVGVFAQVAVADFTGDGQSDLVAMRADGSGVTVFFYGPERFSEAHADDHEIPVSAIAAADLDGNGVSDLLVLDQDAGRVTALFARSDGMLVQDGSLYVGNQVTGPLTVSNLAGNHLPDFVIAEPELGRLLIGENLSLAFPSCACDCDGNRRTDVTELLLGVSIAMGETSTDTCEAADRNGGGNVTIEELVACANSTLRACD